MCVFQTKHDECCAYAIENSNLKMWEKKQIYENWKQQAKIVSYTYS